MAPEAFSGKSERRRHVMGTVIHRILALRTPRDAADDKALDALRFQHLHAAATGAETPRDGGDAPWTTQVIKAIIKCSCNTQNDLCGKRIVV